MIRMACATLAALLLGATTAAGQTKTGTAIAQFTGIEPSARIAALGNAGVALHDDIQAAYYNPGAIGYLDQTTVQFTHSFWFADISYDYAALAVPAGSWGTFFGSVTALNSGEIDVRTVAQPLGTGERYTVQDVALALGYGRRMTARFAAGAQVNYINESIWNTSMRTVTFSVGTVYQVSRSGITLGSSLSNFGTKGRFRGRDLAIQFDKDPERFGDNNALPAEQFTDEFPVPVLFRVGMSFPYSLGAESKLRFTFDAFHPSDATESVSLGWEWSWKSAFAVRGGYQSLFEEDSELGLTAGVGVRSGIGTRHLQLDYAWAGHMFLEDTHRLTVVLGL